jgi:DNA-binding NtrC family response regulator
VKEASEFPGFLGLSASVKRILDSLPKVAGVPMTVLLEGETGTGKEVLAETIHRISPRKNAPFVKVDCAALPLSLMESELFGHERGAFTGALQRRVGRLEQADGGVLFLDEIANLPLEVQAKLLDFLQNHEIVRLGGDRRLKLDVKVIAASNQPLERMVAEGAFRADLYYRINQIKIHLPPLRDRKGDLPILSEHFLRLANAFCNKKVRAFEAPAMEALERHAWPGNVRELKNVIFKAVALSRGESLGAGDLFGPGREQGPVPGRRKPYKKYTRARIEEAIRECGGNIARAARLLEVPRTTVYRIAKWR